MAKMRRIFLNLGYVVAAKIVKNCARAVFFLLIPELRTTIWLLKNIQAELQLLDSSFFCSTPLSNSWEDLNLTVSMPRALNLTVSTVSRPLNNREKRISAKILMNVVSDFGFFFYGMRYCHEKTGRKDGRLGTPHRKPAENLLFLRY